MFSLPARSPGGDPSPRRHRLTKMLTRNNDIDRRIKANREYADLLPPGATVLPPDLVDQRAASASVLGTPRETAPAPVSSDRGS
eukprot:2003743-Prymnesium_polylepis.1